MLRVWCSLVSLKLAKLMTRVQIPAPALNISLGKKEFLRVEFSVGFGFCLFFAIAVMY